MKAILTTVCLALLALPTTPHPQEEGEAPVAREATVMLRLESGEVLWGSILDHDPEGIRFRRLDSGGVVPLAWSFLDPEEESALRLRFGYVEAQGEEMLIDAERILLIDGTELVGRIVNRTEEHLWLKRAEGTLPIDKRRLQGTATLVQVPALDVYTKEELYQLKAFELQAGLLLDGLVGAESHDALAQYSERLFDYPHALEHYREVKLLAPEYDTSRVDAAIARSEQKAALQEQVEALAKIDLYRARKRYDLALEAIELFPALYPDSPLLDDWNELRARVTRYQERDLRDEIVRQVYSWAVRLARQAARQRPTYEEALAYLDDTMLDETMSEDLLSGVQGSLERIAPGIEAEEVQRLWMQRKGGRYRQASFGNGTWLLGETRALATYEEEEEEAVEPKSGSQAEARAKLEDRIQRYLRNQELTRRSRAGGSADEEDPATFWNAWDYAGRYQWILAYFAEFSNLFEIERVRFSSCRECGGSGARDVVYTGSAIAGDSAQNVLVPCPTCHTIGRVRRIRYR
jgi:hypothetical protein